MGLNDLKYDKFNSSNLTEVSRSNIAITTDYPAEVAGSDHRFLAKKLYMANIVKKNQQRGLFLLISLVMHIIAFIFLGTIVLNHAPEVQESVSVQMVNVKQQIKKTRRILPEPRNFNIPSSKLPKNMQYDFPALLSPDSIFIQAGSETIPVSQYEPFQIKEDKKLPQISPLKKPIPAPRVSISKPVLPTPRQNVFELHEKLSKLASASVSMPKPEVKEMDAAILRDFLQNISKRIEKLKRYPKLAMDAGLEGRVVVRFTILNDGTLDEELLLVKSSGAEILDSAAISAIKAAAPFPALPQSLNREQLQIELPMDFRLRKT